jgi:AcrR family transcriptional regulator
MGHREQLLAGAKRCLLERGYAHTTARDIVAASGTNLASIGYHFGSKDALLNAAMIEAMNDWGDEFDRILAVDPTADPLDRLDAMWSAVIESISTHPKLWFASIDVLTQIDHHPELRERLAASFQAGRAWYGALILSPDASVALAGADGSPDGDGSGGSPDGDGDRDTYVALGSLILAVITGLTVQWRLDPDNAPNGSDLVRALRALLAAQGSATKRSAAPRS